MDGNMSVENYESELNLTKILAECVSVYYKRLVKNMPSDLCEALVLEYQRSLLYSKPSYREHSPVKRAGPDN